MIFEGSWNEVCIKLIHNDGVFAIILVQQPVKVGAHISLGETIITWDGFIHERLHSIHFVTCVRDPVRMSEATDVSLKASDFRD